MNTNRVLTGLAMAAALTLPALAQSSASQTLSLTITSGALSITGGGGTSAFSPVGVLNLGGGVNPLTLTNAPTFTISDFRGTTPGWKITLGTSTTASPAGTSLANQHLHYFSGQGAPALSNTGSFAGNVEGSIGGLGAGDSGGVPTGDQDTNAAAVKVVSASSGSTANQGSRTYRVGTAWGLQDVTSGGITPTVGNYTWTMTATISSAP